MIITRTPLRITLGGGGTDLPSYYSKYGGFILSVCISKYVHVRIQKNDSNPDIKLKFKEMEEAAPLDDIHHDLTREALRMLDTQNGLEIESSADVPPGTGLGSSSCYAVGLLLALHVLKGEPVSPRQLAEEDFRMEAEFLGRPIGKQDPYIAAFGGFTALDIERDGAVRVRKPEVSNKTIRTLNQNLLLFYTGICRSTDEILHSQIRAVANGNRKIIDRMNRIKNLGHQILEAVENGRTSDIGPIFHEHWQHKKHTSNKISSEWLDYVYLKALKSGASGGKISGAGGGGYFTFYVEKNHEQFRESMEEMGLKELEYRFEPEGAKVLSHGKMH